MSRSKKTDALLPVDEFGPDYQTWDKSTRIMFLEKRIFLLRKQMIRQERLADNHRSLLRSIHQEYEKALKQLQNKHSELKKVSKELGRAKKNLEQEVRRRTRQLEQKNIALEERARQLKRSNVAMDVLLKRCENNEKSAAVNMEKKVLSEILPVLERLSKNIAGDKHEPLVTTILEDIKSRQRGSTCSSDAKLLDLSDREAMVARLISQGRTCKEAAEIIGLSLRGVQSHCYNIRKKLDLARKVRLKDYLKSLSE